MWTLPQDVTKNRRSHRVPLSPAVMAILKAVGVRARGRSPEREQVAREDGTSRCVQPSEWVFPSPRGNAPMAPTQKAFDRVRLACGKPNFTAHDLRRTAATRMTGELKIPRFTVGRVLNHLEPGVTGVYDRYAYDDENARRAGSVGSARDRGHRGRRAAGQQGAGVSVGAVERGA